MTKIIKIGLSAGHGLYTAGKRCLKSIDPKETREWVLNDRIAVKIEEKLKDYEGIEIHRLDDRTGQRDVPLKERTDMANSLKLDFVDDIHHNAGINGGSGGGITVIRHHITGQSTKDYQDIMYDKIIKHTGLKGNRSNPKPTQNLHMCRETDMSTLTVEHGFMDSTTDVPIILTEKFAEQCANAHVEFYVEVFNLKKKKVPVVGGESNMIYRIRKEWEDANSQKGAYHILDSAIALAEKLSLNVYDSKGVQVYPKKEMFELIVYTELIKLGTRGDGVKLLQTYLNKLGFNAGTPDGIAGANTDKAIRLFQKSYGLTVDGLAGRSTIAKINELIQGNSNKPNPPKENKKNPKYYKSGSTHVIELDPMDLKISVQDKPGSRIGLSNFVTSGFQWHHANGSTYALGILASENRGISNRQPHNKPAGTLLVHRDGTVAIKDIADLSKESMVRFAVSGCSILPTVKMTSAGFVGAYSDIGRRTSRPMIGYRKKDNKIIIAVANCSINEGSNIMKKLGCDSAITLDAGGSTILKVDNKALVSTTRRLHSVITW